MRETIVASERPGPDYYGEWKAPHLFTWRKCRPGYVYVVHFGDRVYKIGKTKDVDQRRRAFGEHELILVLKEWADVDQYEREIHRRYAHRRLYGELFRLEPDDLIDLSQWFEVWSGREWESVQ